MKITLGPQDQAELSRPRVWLKSITFTTRRTLTLGEHEVIVVVGPNNAGKSLFLRELWSLLLNGQAVQPRLLVGDVEVETDSNTNRTFQWARSKTPERLTHMQDPQFELPMGRQSQNQVVNEWERGLGGNGFGNMTLAFATYLPTEARLGLTQGAATIDTLSQSPSDPVQHIYEDDQLELRLSRLIKQAFGQELIVNRGAGSHIHLHIGERPLPPVGKDRLSKEFRTAVHALQKVADQGDGVKAYVGLLLNTIVLDRDITLIDEPEAFLHPPQATLLGKSLAAEIPHPRQLVVATHSSDFLRGLLDDPKSPVRVVRLQRARNATTVAELDPATVRHAWEDPLLRYSGVFDGLFHDGVIVCESDSDCRFYSALMDVVPTEGRRLDLLLVHGSGKARVPVIVRALRAINVPVRAVFDFDVLSDETVLKNTIEAQGGNWGDINTDWRTVKAAIESKRPELQTAEVRQRVEKVLDGVTGNALPPNSINEIRNILRSASAWSEAKKNGKSFVPRGEQTVAYERLAAKLRASGVHIVEVGELEGFCPSLSKHGPAWTVAALERDLREDRELDNARAFAKELLNGW